MTDEDSEVFEITDFTTASEWERFVACLEEVIHEWKLASDKPRIFFNKGELSSGSWEEKSENLQFADFKFVIRKHTFKPLSNQSQTNQIGKDTRDSPEAGDAPKERDELNKADEIDSVPAVWMEMMSVQNDFPSRAHCLCRWYGLHEFVVLSPASQKESISTESRSNLLLSSVAIALNNTGCQVPIFVQAQQQWRRLYLGEAIFPGYRTSFEMVHLKHIPSQYNHLAGLLDVFRLKLACPLSPHPPITVSVRFTYVLQDWPHYSWTQAPPDLDSLMGGEVGCADFADLPFGACEDPVLELHLATTWPNLSEEMIVDNDVYSDLDPIQAPYWAVRVRFADDPQCLMGDYLKEFIKLCKREEDTAQLLGKSIMESDSDPDVNAEQALQRLTEPVPYTMPSLGTVVTRATTRLQIKPEEAPITAELLNEILLFLFPDAKEEIEGMEEPESSSSGATSRSTSIASGMSEVSKKSKSAATTPMSESAKGIESHIPTDNTVPMVEEKSDMFDIEDKYKEIFRQFKSAPYSSLTYKLAVCMSIVNHTYGGLRAVAHLWQEFVLEMRYRWENNYFIPDLERGAPNMGSSLIHQKLQMLNCCIERKKAREESQGENRPKSPIFRGVSREASKKSKDDSLSISSSDEEFYECMDDDNEDENGGLKRVRTPTKQTSTNKDSAEGRSDTLRPRSESDVTGSTKSSEDVSTSEMDDSFQEALPHKPEGRLRVCSELRLLNVDEPMYIPMTQEPAPMTEDLLEQHAEVLAKLGTSSEGAHLRARMQSQCLLSDMESFKAANPGATLGDFVRWYSPRDWVEEEKVEEDGTVTKSSQLSQRMQIPGNMWVEVWQSAKAVPARRQRRLFDDTKEAEKVLHYLAGMKPAEVAGRVMPMLIHAAVGKILSHQESELSTMKSLISSISAKSTKAMRAPKPDLKRYEDIIRQLSLAEVIITRAQSLKTKFSPQREQLETGPTDEEFYKFVSSLLEQPEISVVGAARGPCGRIVHGLYAAAQKSAYMLSDDEDENLQNLKISDFPTPAGKEYILRTTLPRPAPWSRPTPQRMFCTLVKDDFRLAGAFSSDTTFQ